MLIGFLIHLPFVVALADVVPDCRLPRKDLRRPPGDVVGEADAVFLQQNKTQEKKRLRVIEALIEALAKELRRVDEVFSLDCFFCFFDEAYRSPIGVFDPARGVHRCSERG